MAAAQVDWDRGPKTRGAGSTGKPRTRWRCRRTSWWRRVREGGVKELGWAWQLASSPSLSGDELRGEVNAGGGEREEGGGV
nr:unnamed protein product [Digitaria exilis]